MDKIICSNIWKIFGNDEERILDNLDPNLSRDEVQEKTGHVVACLLYTSDAADE